MTPAMKTIIYPVKDLEKAKRLFAALTGVAPHANSGPYYAYFETEGLHIGLDPNGQGGGPTAFWTVPDIKARLAALVAAGAAPGQDIRDVGGGRLIATVRDEAGNLVGLMQDA